MDNQQIISYSQNLPETPNYFFDESIRDRESLIDFLKENNWPTGLINFFISSANKVAIRYFIYDDSGSMTSFDATRFVNGISIPSTRWDELKDVMKFHIKIANRGLINTKMFFLNDDAIHVGITKCNEESLVSKLNVMKGGMTPLCRTIRNIIEEVSPHFDRIRQSEKEIELVICTDGVSSDGYVGEELFKLRNLPIRIVLRLCTNEQKIVDYWNEIDKTFDLKLDIIDDYISEARQIQDLNPRFCYGYPLHQLREYGFSDPLIDHIDEMRLNDDQLETLRYMILGRDEDTGTNCSVTHKHRLWIESKNSQIRLEDVKVTPIPIASLVEVNLEPVHNEYSAPDEYRIGEKYNDKNDCCCIIS